MQNSPSLRDLGFFKEYVILIFRVSKEFDFQIANSISHIKVIAHMGYFQRQIVVIL